MSQDRKGGIVETFLTAALEWVVLIFDGQIRFENLQLPDIWPRWETVELLLLMIRHQLVAVGGEEGGIVGQDESKPNGQAGGLGSGGGGGFGSFLASDYRQEKKSDKKDFDSKVSVGLNFRFDGEKQRY